MVPAGPEPLPEASYEALFQALERVLEARREGRAMRPSSGALDPELVGFCAQLVAALEAREPVLLCGGVMCTLHGAPLFQRRLASRLEQAGVPSDWTAVHCLANCDFGPNLTCRGRIYGVRSGRVTEDREALRRELGGGAVRLDDDTLPERE